MESTVGLQTFEFEEGSGILSQNEAMVEKRIAEARDIDLGDELEVSIAGATEAFTIVGIVKSIFSSVFIDYAKAPAPTNETLLTGAFVELSPGSNAETIGNVIAQDDQVESVQTHEEATTGIKAVFQTYDIILYFLVAMCLAIVFLGL